MDTKVLGASIRYHRQVVRVMTLRELTEASGVSVAALSDIERGAVMPSGDALKKIGAALGVDLVAEVEKRRT